MVKYPYVQAAHVFENDRAEYSACYSRRVKTLAK